MGYPHKKDISDLRTMDETYALQEYIMQGSEHADNDIREPDGSSRLANATAKSTILMGAAAIVQNCFTVTNAIQRAFLRSMCIYRDHELDGTPFLRSAPFRPDVPPLFYVLDSEVVSAFRVELVMLLSRVFNALFRATVNHKLSNGQIEFLALILHKTKEIFTGSPVQHFASVLRLYGEV